MPIVLFIICNNIIENLQQLFLKALRYIYINQNKIMLRTYRIIFTRNPENHLEATCAVLKRFNYVKS